ncbi:3-deoxy-manno-octulosonate cytidylyltransferase (CMP-KDO synthetase) [Thermoflavifilum aggregans]|uniref:3-deoxy-manno-octulosonate cytidylyltransferase n=1 Tax=Thermoflavifilum aggregans TaxID=454188 RepID=A0A2M9CVW4_9BACT|nr:3-deoxy-manno-octulosonate cytidylyltransferase [Thermoflavifilum aggregans]PJJ76043.1 3-deoxy-manno-octulosonate cytidylyltransferase (CMP-KDO synthetase) [Thermoflavifilum aggregans]
MRVVAIIPARYASTRFPGKPLADIAGKSMIQRVYERIAKAGCVDEIWVATDDPRILQHVESWHGKAVMTSSHHQTGTERCAEALGQLRLTPDIVLNVQGDEPFIRREHLQTLIACFEDQEVMIASLMKPVQDMQELHNPHLPKVVTDQQMNAMYFSRQPVPFVRDQPQDQWLATHRFYKHIGMYAFRPHILHELVKLAATPLEKAEKLEQLRWLEHGYRIRMGVTDIDQFSIDTPEDLQRCLQLLDQLEDRES